jgi:DNA-binding response OmpR family regulator
MTGQRTTRLTCGALALDVPTRTLFTAHHTFRLTPKECRLLEAFLVNPGQVLTRQYLMKEVWETDFVADTRTLEVHVHWLRRKIEADVPRTVTIHTVRGVGYVLRPALLNSGSARPYPTDTTEPAPD